MSKDHDSDITENLFLIKRDIFANLNCHQVGIIDSFNASNQTATVRIATKRIITTNPDKSCVYKDYSPLVEVPVINLYGGAAGITFPIQKGDECLILFNDRQIDNWLLKGGIQPFDIFRFHDFSDGFALVGIRNYQKALSGYSSNSTDWFFSAAAKITQGASETKISNTTVNLDGVVKTKEGVSGSFIDKNGKVITVKNGLITGIN